MKGTVRRKILSKVTAIVMAIVMVLGVVYIDNRNERAEAADDTEVTSIPTLVINEASTADTVTKTITLKYYSSGNITYDISNINAQLGDTVDGQGYVVKYSADKSSEITSGTINASSLYIYVCKQEDSIADLSPSIELTADGYTEAEWLSGSVQISYDGTTKKASVTSGTTTTESIVNSVSSISDAGTYYYGDIYYSISQSNADSGLGWQSQNTFDINDGTEAAYYGYIGLDSNGDGNPDTQAVSSATADCDNKAPVISDFQIDGSSVTGNETTLSDQLIIIPHTVSVTAGENGTLVVKKDGTEQNVNITGSEAGGQYKYEYTINPSEQDAGKTVTYEFSVKDSAGNESDKKTVIISYLSSDITISNVNVTVNGGDALAIKENALLYSTTGNVDVTWDITSATDVMYIKLESSDDGDEWVDMQSWYTSPESYSIERPSNDCIKYYKITADNRVGKKASFVFSVCYDTEAPKIAENSVKVTESGQSDELGQDEKCTYKKAYNINFTATDNLSGVESYKVYYTVSGSEGTTTVYDVSGTVNGSNMDINISVPENNEEFKGKTVTYYVTLKDKAGNVLSDEQITSLEYYKDNVDIEIEFDFSNSMNNAYGDSTQNNNWVVGEKVGILTNATFYSIKVTITSDVPIDTDTVSLTDKTGSIDTSSVNKRQSYIKQGETDYTTDIVYNMTETSSMERNYKFTAKNTNGAEGSKDATILFVDITNPSISYNGVASSSVQNSDWYRNLTIIFTAGDSSGNYNSGIKTFEVSQDNGEYSAVTADSSGKYQVEVKKSDTTDGTTVKVKAVDNAGNVIYWPEANNENAVETYKVDNTAPELSIKVTSENAGEILTGQTVSGNPVINASIKQGDKLGGSAGITIKYTESDGNTPTVYINSNTNGTDISINQKLSELLNADMIENGMPKDGTYIIELTASDNIGSVGPETFEITIDNTAPKISEILLNNGSDDISTTIDNISDYEAENHCFDGYNGKELNVTFNVTDDTSEVSKIVVNQTTDEDTKQDVFEGVDTAAEKVTILNSTNNEGTEVELTVYDEQGNYKVYTYHFLVDSENPEAGVSVTDERYENDNSILNGDPVISSSDSDNILVDERSMVIIKPDDTRVTITNDSYKGEKKLSELIGASPADGKYTITVSAKDRAKHEATDSVSFTLDNTNPVNEMTVTAGQPAKISKYSNTSYNGAVYGQYYAGNVTLDLSVSDVNECNIIVTDNGNVINPEWTLINGVYKATVTVMPEGTHTIGLSSTDSADNSGTDRSVSFTIDRTAPAITTVLNGTTHTNSTGVRYLAADASLNVSVSDTNKDSDDLTQTVRVTQPGQQTVTTTQKVGEGTGTYTTEADYEISYQSVDRAGNASEVRTVNFRVDKTAPELSITGTTEGGTSTSQVTMTFGIKEAFYWDMPAGRIDVYRAIDGTQESLVTTIDFAPDSADDTLSQTFTEDGEYRFEFTAEDRTGNSATRSYTFILDRNAPEISLSGVKNFDVTGDSVIFNINVIEDFYTSNNLILSGTRTDINGTMHEIDFGDYNVNSSRSSVVSREFTEDGIYDINVTSTDKAGNSTVKVIHFTIDKTPPVIIDFADYDGKVLNSFNWNYEYDDLVSDLTVCDVTVYLDGVEYDGLSEVSDGRHVLRVVAIDEMDNEVEKTIEFIIDTKAPNIMITGVEDGDNIEDAVTVTVSLQLEEDTLDSVTLNGVEQSIENNVATFIVSSEGNYEIVAKAHDEAGNTAEQTINFEYGSNFSIIWIIIICVVLVAALIIFIILLKRRKKDK